MQALYDASLKETDNESLAVFRLSVGDGRVFIQALDAGLPVFVNATALRHRERRELLEDDHVTLGGAQVVFTRKYWWKAGRMVSVRDLVVLPPRSKPPQAASLKEPADGSPAGVSLTIPEASLTAIMGPAGCGKTLLLDVLSGTAVPAAGRVTFGRHRIVPGKDRSLARQIGHVSQHEAMTAELTIRQSLDYRLRLRYPGMAAGIRERRIAAEAHALAIEDLLDQRIGTADRLVGGLSGGQRKQAGLAHELLTRPELLCLDEPTSGLSADDAELVVRQLRALADAGITVIVTVHQPPPKVFALFQHLVLMGQGGRVLYSGPVTEAAPLAARATGTPLAVADGENPADYLVKQGAKRPNEIYHEFHKDSARQGAGGDGDPSCSLPQIAPPAAAMPWSSGVRVFQTLVARNVRVFAQDTTNLLLAALQIPAIALIVLFAFFKFETDAPEQERLSRVLTEVIQKSASYRQAGQPVPMETLVRDAIARPGPGPNILTDLGARMRGAVLFTLVASAFWVGLLGACREMVADKDLLRHECRTCATVRTFLAAKMSSLGLLALPQCALLALTTAPFLLHLSSAGLAGLVAALWLTALAAAGVGLLTATLAPTPRAALTAVPLIMVPQLLFAGLMRPEAALAPGVVVPRWLGFASMQRWGFEIALNMVGGQVQSISLVQGQSLRIVDTLDQMQRKSLSIHDCFFHPGPWWPPVLVLLGVALASAFVSERHLRKKFHL
jgi:ABC-type multidrug transport system ATPase subunit